MSEQGTTKKKRFRVVPVINDGAIWYSLQRRGWFSWKQLWCFCTKERAEAALDEYETAYE